MHLFFNTTRVIRDIKQIMNADIQWKIFLQNNYGENFQILFLLVIAMFSALFGLMALKYV